MNNRTFRKLVRKVIDQDKAVGEVSKKTNKRTDSPAKASSDSISKILEKHITAHKADGDRVFFTLGSAQQEIEAYVAAEVIKELEDVMWGNISVHPGYIQIQPILDRIKELKGKDG